MKNKVLVSIIIPVYNVENYIGDCLESVLAQTYKDIEIVVINDGSTDNSLSICKNYDDPRIKIVNKENGGLSDARNVGVKFSSGELIMFVDSDDIVHPNIVEELFKNLSTYKCDCAGCDIIPFDDGKKILWKQKDENIQVWKGEEILHQLVGNYTSQLTVGGCKLYRKEIIDRNPYPRGKIHEDEFTAYKIWSSCSSFVYTDRKMYGYRQRDNSIMNTYNLKAEKDQIEAKNDIFSYYLANVTNKRAQARAYFLLLRKIELSYYKIYKTKRTDAYLKDLWYMFRDVYNKYAYQRKNLTMYEKIILSLFYYFKSGYILLEQIKRGNLIK